MSDDESSLPSLVTDGETSIPFFQYTTTSRRYTPLESSQRVVVQPEMSTISMKSPKFNFGNEHQAAIAASNLWSTTPQTAVPRNLKYRYNCTMGEGTADVESEASVRSEVPSISREARSKDAVKLENMVTEYSQLKQMANNTMEQFDAYSLQWKKQMNIMEEQYKQQLDNSKKGVEELRKQIKEIENNFTMQIEALEIARKKDREENIKAMSEQTSLLENMAAEITKLEQQQQAFDIFEEKKIDESKQQEHEVVIKDLQNQLSELLAANLDLKASKELSIKEIDCLQEQIKGTRVINREEQIYRQKLERALLALQLTCHEQKERITWLETENESYRNIFKMERQDHEAVVQKKWQNLIKAKASRYRAETSALNDSQITDATAGAASGVSEGENLPSTPAAQ